MERKNNIIIPVTGIVTCVMYFASVAFFLTTGWEAALTVWELMTIVSGPLVLLVMTELCEYVCAPVMWQKMMTAFMSCVCALTGAAHIVNISVTRRLIREGVEVPLFFQIGQWPSLEMAIDYLAWGFFMGLSFLCLSLPVLNRSEGDRYIKIISLICGILCLMGFSGALIINENLWYLAPMGYGVGLLVLCILMIRRGKRWE